MILCIVSVVHFENHLYQELLYSKAIRLIFVLHSSIYRLVDKLLLYQASHKGYSTNQIHKSYLFNNYHVKV